MGYCKSGTGPDETLGGLASKLKAAVYRQRDRMHALESEAYGERAEAEGGGELPFAMMDVEPTVRPPTTRPPSSSDLSHMVSDRARRAREVAAQKVAEQRAAAARAAEKAAAARRLAEAPRPVHKDRSDVPGFRPKPEVTNGAIWRPALPVRIPPPILHVQPRTCPKGQVLQGPVGRKYCGGTATIMPVFKKLPAPAVQPIRRPAAPRVAAPIRPIPAPPGLPGGSAARPPSGDYGDELAPRDSGGPPKIAGGSDSGGIGKLLPIAAGLALLLAGAG